MPDWLVTALQIELSDEEKSEVITKVQIASEKHDRLSKRLNIVEKNVIGYSRYTNK